MRTAKKKKKKVPQKLEADAPPPALSPIVAGSSLCWGQGGLWRVTSKLAAIPHPSLCAFCAREEADGEKKKKKKSGRQ